MSFDEMLGDEILIESPTGQRVGSVKASVQGSKVFVHDQSLVIEEGGKILRPLPNGKMEVYNILEVNFHKDPFGHSPNLSHYEIKTRKESSLIPAHGSTTINITGSHNIQIGNQNVQNIVGSFELLTKALDSSDALPEEKTEVKSRLQAFLSHPLTQSILGSAADKLLGMLGG